MPGPKVLAICGSLRKNSYNRSLVAALPELAPEGMEIAVAPSIADIPHYDADLQNEGFPASVQALIDAIRAADGVMIVSPEYNYSIPGVLKNAIDWVSRAPQQPFAGKPVALQSASTGVLGGARAQYHLRQVMVFVEAHVFNKPEIFVTQAKSKFDEASGALTDPVARDLVSKQLAAFSSFIAQLNK